MTLLSAIPQPWRRRLAWAGAGVLACGVAYVTGRYSTPTRVEQRTEWREIRSYETQWVTRVEYQDRTKIRTRIVTVEKMLPSGERETTRTEETGADLNVSSTSSLSGQSSETTTGTVATARVSETSRAGWAIGVAGVWDPARLSSTPERVGLEIDRRLFGTVWVGVRVSAEPDMGEPQVGAAVRVEF